MPGELRTRAVLARKLQPGDVLADGRRLSECPTCLEMMPRPGDVLTGVERALANRYRRIYPWLRNG